MAERRNSLQPEPAVSRNNKRRRTMMDSVSDVARWLLPSWASEGTAESSQDRHHQAASGQHLAAGTGLSNGERNPKRARPNEAPRREPMGRLSPVASVAPSTTSAQIEPDLDDGSDSSTSGCSSLSITTPATAEACSAADAKSNQRRNRPIQNTKESKTRDVSISVDQTSIVAETSVTASPSLNFSLFSRPSRALSSTMNASLPISGSHGSGTRSLSSSLHKPERSLNRSIFYEGKTTYGGAAAHRKLNLFSPSPYQMATKRSKPTSNVNVSESSSAAKRLIEALERMNTPVQNAKKIPLARPESIPTVNSEARRKEALESIASLRQSSAPPPLSSCRSSVQPARIGSNVKPVLSSYPIDVDESDAGLPSNASSVPVITPTPRTTSASLDNFESDRANSAGGKMKSAKTIQQHMSRKIPVEEEPPPTAPDLPSAPLPIKDLPSFSFATKPPSLSVSSMQDCHKTSAIRSPLTSLADFSNKPFEKQQMPSALVCPTSDASEAFTFAAPVDLDKPTKTLHCKEEFDFKDPLYLKKDQLNRSGGFAVAGPTMTSGNTFTLKTKTVPESTKVVAVPEVLSTGSVMDIIGKNDTRKDAPEPNTSSGTSKTTVWECPKCLVRNPSGACQACETKKASTSAMSVVTSAPPSLTTTVANSWGDQFKKPTSSWDCSTCCVNNKSEISSCVACGAAKPGADNGKSAAKPFGTPVANQWGNLYKSPAGQWSCKTCLVDNKAEATKCVACESPNPSAKAPPTSTSPNLAPVSTVKSPLSAMIKMAPGWSCDTCLVRNDLDKTKCVACETPKPGSVAAQDSTSAPKAISSAFKFGVPTSDENKNITTEPVTLVFGMKSTEKGASDGSSVPNGFKFGLTPAKPTEDKNATEQTNSSAKGSGSSEFSFGTPANSVAPSLTPLTSAAPAVVSAKTPEASSSGTSDMSIGSSSAGFSGFGTTWGSGTSNKTDAPPAGLFAFGTSTTPASTSTPAATAAAAATTQKSFAFGMTSSATPATPTAQPSAATFSFGATTATSSAAATTTAPTATFAFGGFGTPAKAPAAGGLFGPAASGTSVFGTNTTVTTATTSQPTTSTGFSFTSPASTGTTATPTVSASTAVPATPSPMFAFGNPSATGNTTETQKSSAAFVFGSTSSTAGGLSGFTFGSAAAAATTAASATPTFAFGAAPAANATPLPTASNGPSVFGSASLQSSTPAFGVTNANPTAAAPASSNVFQFNANPTAAAPGSTTPFAFTAGGTSTAAAPSPGGLFAFGSTNTNTAAPTPTTNPTTGLGAATPFLFGAQSATATPGATPAPNFNFGGAPATPAAGTFQFGAQPAGQNPGTFQFGGATPTMAPSLGFPAPNAENPFNATIAQGRRVRRAVRRRGAR